MVRLNKQGSESSLLKKICMKDIKEFRIGNWLFEAGEPRQIYMLDSGGISFFRINDIPINKETGATLNGGEFRFDTIPLSDKILIKCGFEKIELPTNYAGGHPGFKICILKSANRWLMLAGKSGSYMGHINEDEDTIFCWGRRFSILSLAQ
jgi:hypothetical protein